MAYKMRRASTALVVPREVANEQHDTVAHDPPHDSRTSRLPGLGYTGRLGSAEPSTTPKEVEYRF